MSYRERGRDHFCFLVVAKGQDPFCKLHSVSCLRNIEQHSRVPIDFDIFSIGKNYAARFKLFARKAHG